MLIDWLIIIVYLGILLAWNPALWAPGILQLGIAILSLIILAREIRNKAALHLELDTLALFVIVLWGPLQIAFHQTVNSFETWNASVYWLINCAAYLVARALLRDREARQRFLNLTLWIGAGIAIVSILFLVGSPTKVFGLFESRYQPFGPFIYKNHFAVFVELLLPIAFYRMISGGRRAAAHAILVAALMACIVASLSRGGLIVAGAELIALTALTWKQGRITGAMLLKVGLPLAALIVTFALIVGWRAMLNRFHDPHPFEHRTELVQSTWRMVQAHPIAGFGLGTWRTVYPEFATFDIAVVANEAHNDWIQWAAEGGVPFAALVLFFAVWVSRFAVQHIWAVGVPAVFLHCLIDFPTHSQSLAVFLFLFAGALTAAHEGLRRTKIQGPEWRVVSVRTASE